MFRESKLPGKKSRSLFAPGAGKGSQLTHRTDKFYCSPITIQMYAINCF